MTRKPHTLIAAAGPWALLLASLQADQQNAETTGPSDHAAAALRAELKNYPHKIIYEAYDHNNWELFIMNADGSGKRNLTRTPQVHEMYPQASPDGSHICFLADVQHNGQTVRSLWYMNADGSGRTKVADHARQPCWSPDGKRIAFVRQEFDRFNIKDFASRGLYFYELKTGRVIQHPNKGIHHLYCLSWSADGKWIVATVHGGMGFGHAILAIEVDGQRVYNLGIGGCRPCISPDGKRLTWCRDDHTIGLADVDFTGARPKLSNVRALHHHPKLHLYHADFSPDGRYITFSIGPGGRMRPSGPGTHAEVAEMVGVRGPWNLYLKRSTGQGPLLQLTFDPAMSNKESEWLCATATGASGR